MKADRTWPGWRYFVGELSGSQALRVKWRLEALVDALLDDLDEYVWELRAREAADSHQLELDLPRSMSPPPQRGPR